MTFTRMMEGKDGMATALGWFDMVSRQFWQWRRGRVGVGSEGLMAIPVEEDRRVGFFLAWDYCKALEASLSWERRGSAAQRENLLASIGRCVALAKDAVRMPRQSHGQEMAMETVIGLGMAVQDVYAQMTEPRLSPPGWRSFLSRVGWWPVVVIWVALVVGAMLFR